MKILLWLFGLLIPLAYAAPVGPVQYTALPACLDTGGNHLNYNATTGALICGNTGGSSGVTSVAPGTSGNITTSPNPITGTGTVDTVAAPTFNNSATAAPAGPAANVLQLHLAGNTNEATAGLIDVFGTASGLWGCRAAKGTPAAPTAITVNMTVCDFSAFGYDGTAYSVVQAQFEAQADENWTTGAHGMRWRMMGTPIGSTTIAEWWRLTDGHFLIGTTTDDGTDLLQVAGGVEFPLLATSGTIGGSVCRTAAGVLVYNSAANCFSGGTVTTISVATANGFSGTVATPTTTPVITLNTSSMGIPNANVGPAPLPTPGTGATLVAPRSYYVCTTTCTVTPPVPAAGYEFCIMNDDNVSTVITMAAIGSSARYENTARTAYGTAGTGTFTSGGAVGDKVCLLGRDSTHYLTVSFTGTWTAS